MASDSLPSFINGVLAGAGAAVAVGYEFYRKRPVKAQQGVSSE